MVSMPHHAAQSHIGHCGCSFGYEAHDSAADVTLRRVTVLHGKVLPANGLSSFIGGDGIEGFQHLFLKMISLRRISVVRYECWPDTL
jgi:hypothetical protein